MPVVELNLDSSGSVDGLKKYDNAVDKSSSKTGTAFSKMRTSVLGLKAGIATVAAGVGTATAALAVFTLALSSAGQKAKEIENLSRLAGAGVEEFQNLSAVTERYGITAEALGDISKDVQDKLGDFIATGAGEFADFFENVAPKVGLTAEALSQLSGPDALIAVKAAMDEVNLSAAEQTFYLESLGNDLSLLNPLLADSGKLWKEGAAEAAALGTALSKVQTANLRAGAKSLSDLTNMVGALKDKVVAELAPAFTIMVDAIKKAFSESNLSIDSMAQLIAGKLLDSVSTVVEGIRFLHNGFLGVELVLHGIIVAVGELARGWGTFTGIISAALEKIGLENPFKKMGEDAIMFSDSARQGFKDQLTKIEEVNKKYDSMKSAVSKVVTEVKKASTETANLAKEADVVPDGVYRADIGEKQLRTSIKDSTAAIKEQKAAQDEVTNAVKETNSAASSSPFSSSSSSNYNDFQSRRDSNYSLNDSMSSDPVKKAASSMGSVSAHGNSLTDEEWGSLEQWQKDALTASASKTGTTWYDSRRPVGSRWSSQGGYNEEGQALMAEQFMNMNNVSNVFNFTESVSRSDIESIMQDATRIESRA